MNISKLEVGKEFKNYKVLCEELEIKAQSGSVKKAQFKEIARYCNYEKVGHKIIIKKVYATPLPKIDMRGKSENSRNNNKLRTPISVTNPVLANQWLEKENGMKIPETLTRRSTEEFWWKCSNCHHHIFASPTKRLQLSKGCTDEFITCPYCNLSKDAKRIFKFLYDCEFNFKQEYMFDDLIGLGKKKLRFDFAILNKDKLIALIEFDGGYHDKELNPDIDNYKVVSTHDKMKDDYCVSNDIPLLRIHHSEADEIESILSAYLIKLNIPLHIKKNIEEYERNIISEIILSYEKQKELLQLEMLDLDKKIHKYKLMIS